MNAFEYYEIDSWLHRRNPAAKLAAHLIVALLLTIVFDPLTPLAFLAIALVSGWLLGRIPVPLLLRSLVPFWLLGVTLVLSNALFVDNPDGARVIWSGGPFTMTVEGVMIGLSLAERGVAIAAYTLLLLLTTDPEDLVRSLVQQVHLPARFAYPALAAYRFLPLLSEEWETIRLAQRLRGQGRRSGPAGWLRERRRLLVPLLANAIRRADRVALAMDSRAFGSGRERTHYRLLRFGKEDALVIVTAAAGGTGILVASSAFGVLRIWSGTLGA